MFNTSPRLWQKTDENGKMLDDPMIKNVSLGLVSWIWLRIRVQSLNLSFFKYPRVILLSHSKFYTCGDVHEYSMLYWFGEF
jgi:hypothetical protein